MSLQVLLPLYLVGVALLSVGFYRAQLSEGDPPGPPLAYVALMMGLTWPLLAGIALVVVPVQALRALARRSRPLT